MLNISTPPPPHLSAALTVGVAGVCVVLGAVLVLWGRVVHRSFLAAVGAAAGVVLADPVARRFGLPAVGVGVVAILGLAAVGALTARILWAMAGGAVFGLAAAVVLLSGMMEALPPASQPTFQADAAANLQSWLTECRRFLVEGLGALWADHRGAVLWALCLGGGVPLVTLLLLPRLGRIFMTALVGSAGLIGGVLLTATHLHRATWPTRWSGYLAWGGIGLVLLVFSLVYQYCGDVAARQRAKQDQDKAEGAEADGKGTSRKSASRGR